MCKVMFRILSRPRGGPARAAAAAVALAVVATLPAAAATVGARPWSEDVIYFVMTDRFRDGDPANNIPADSDPGLHDPAQRNLASYHGGDFRGLEKALASGYFNRLGITAIWITPPVRNVWRSGFDLGGWKSGYHGYWTQDFLDIDLHLTSRQSLAGEPYPEGAEGRMRHYRDLVELAHSKGIKIVQDVVLNHAGPVFYYDANGNGRLDPSGREEWIQPFRDDGFHGNARWGDVAEWNMRRTMPDGPRELLGCRIPTTGVLASLETYGRKGFSSDSLGKDDGEEVVCDFFSLRDLWTDPASDHFDRLVDEFVEIYAFYLLEVGVDGLRLDTVKHVHHGFWDAFTERLRRRLGPAAREKVLFGEIYDTRPERLGQYTWRTDAPANPAPCLDSVLAFELCFAMREYLRHPGGDFGSGLAVEEAMKSFSQGRFDDGRYYFNRTPGPDGLNSVEKSITFIENHDGLNRFRVRDVTERRHELAQGLVMCLPGIPCLYYGAEVALLADDGRIGEDSETGRLTLWPGDEDPAIDEVAERGPFRTIAALAAARGRWPVLRHGRFVPLWIDSPEDEGDDGVLAFARVGQGMDENVVVVLNASSSAAQTGALDLRRVFGVETPLTGHVLIGDEPVVEAGDRLPAPANSLVLFSPAPAE